MKNKLIDLNNHLFAQLERLSEEDISEEDLKKEISRTKAVTGVSKQIIENGRLVLDGQRAAQGDGLIPDLPEMLQVEHKP